MKKISINEKGKRNIKLMLGFIALGATVGSFATYGIMNKVEKIEEPKNGIIFKNEKERKNYLYITIQNINWIVI